MCNKTHREGTTMIDEMMEGDAPEEGNRMALIEQLQSLIDEMAELEMKGYDEPEMEAPAEGLEGDAPDLGEVAEEAMPEPVEDAAEDALGEDVKDFFTGPKPKDSKGMAMVISSKLTGKGGKKKGRGRRKK